MSLKITWLLSVFFGLFVIRSVVVLNRVLFCVACSSGADTAAGVVATLLELGADVNRDDGDPEVRYTPLHSAVANEVPFILYRGALHCKRFFVDIMYSLYFRLILRFVLIYCGN